MLNWWIVRIGVMSAAAAAVLWGCRPSEDHGGCSRRDAGLDAKADTDTRDAAVDVGASDAAAEADAG